MAKIKPISDLRNYNTVLKDCTIEEPVFLTKNGRGKYVILDMDYYNKLNSEVKLLIKLAKAEMRVENGEKYLSMAELKTKLEV